MTRPFTNRAQCSTKRIKISDMKPIYFTVDWTDIPRMELKYPTKYENTSIGRLCDVLTRRVNALLRVAGRSAK